MANKKCPQCGKIYDSDKAFCRTCGVKLEDVPVEKAGSNKTKSIVFFVLLAVVAAVAFFAVKMIGGNSGDKADFSDNDYSDMTPADIDISSTVDETDNTNTEVTRDLLPAEQYGEGLAEQYMLVQYIDDSTFGYTEDYNPASNKKLGSITYLEVNNEYDENGFLIKNSYENLETLLISKNNNDIYNYDKKSCEMEYDFDSNKNAVSCKMKKTTHYRDKEDLVRDKEIDFATALDAKGVAEVLNEQETVYVHFLTFEDPRADFFDALEEVNIKMYGTGGSYKYDSLGRILEKRENSLSGFESTLCHFKYDENGKISYVKVEIHKKSENEESNVEHNTTIEYIKRP